METKEYRTVDKSRWERGPWDSEPDKMQFTDKETGLPCLIVRNGVGALCGYVGVPEGHRNFGVDYDGATANDGGYISVHGGLTFADSCHAHADGESRGICHLPSKGEPDHVWWLGFDCAHAGDYTPSSSQYPQDCFRQGWDEQYRDVSYVKREIASLARQLSA